MNEFVFVVLRNGERRLIAMYFFISSTSQSAKDVNMNHMNSFCSPKCAKSIVDGKLQCDCGEDVGIFNWCWSRNHSSSNARISNNGKDILFHPLYSSGTAVVRGNAPFQPNLHYYWEIKMISNLYGTDVMVGIGTSKIVVSDWSYRFCSMLGIDSQSWGYSYHGKIQHNKFVRKYGSQFGQGSIVGVHLDMCSGTLEYYVNRKPLGIAFRRLKGRELYPMVSSTAAQSAVRITCAVTEEPTLQMRCLEFISKCPALYRMYKEIPGLTRLYEQKYFWIVPTTEEDEKRRMAEFDNDLMCPLNFKNFLKRTKELRTIHWIPPEILEGYNEERDSDTDHAPAWGSPSPNASADDSDSSSASGAQSPSTSQQEREESRNKIRRTDSFSSASNDNKKSKARV
ncbi:hypothetical protein NQ318_022325 [Aromia moschata]|uniref:B30.2/SPRY domain-containing protein n=1 Tax=Aromia moschata TaxID=1265417 RepID=A0AAV8Z4J5_9CUCU|nr:hypothetical protein NQ318_022325 [Aromia moschata]